MKLNVRESSATCPLRYLLITQARLKDRWALNLSSKELSALECRGLEKGLKFAMITSIKIPAAEIVAAAEEGNSRLAVHQRRLIRAEVSDTPRTAKTSLKKISRDVFSAFLTLKKDSDRLILSADKGNCVAVMFGQTAVPQEGPVSAQWQMYPFNLKYDPTSKAQRKVNRMLLDLKTAHRLRLRTKRYSVVLACQSP